MVSKLWSIKGHPFYFSNDSIKNRSIFIIIGIHIFEYICNRKVVMFPTSPEQCLVKVKSRVF